MADLSDVEDALADLIAPPFYPSGTGQPPAIAASMVKIYSGWPQSDALDADVRANKVNVSIFAKAIERNTTRYTREWRELSRATPTLTVAVSGSSLTIGGTISVPQNIAAMVKGQNYVYAVQANDTLATAAAALAALINVDTPASATGAVITAAGITSASIGVVGKLAREVRRQQKQFVVTIWAPNDALRVAAAKIIDPIISALDYLPLADGSMGLLTYVGSNDNDDPQEALIYRRDIVFWVEYPTLEIIDAVEFIAGSVTISGTQQGANPDANFTTNVGG